MIFRHRVVTSMANSNLKDHVSSVPSSDVLSSKTADIISGLLCRVDQLLDGLSLRTIEHQGFEFRCVYLLLCRLPSKANDFYVPRATGLKAPIIHLSSSACLPKEFLPRVGPKTDLHVKKPCLALAVRAFGGRVRACPHNDNDTVYSHN